MMTSGPAQPIVETQQKRPGEAATSRGPATNLVRGSDMSKLIGAIIIAMMFAIFVGTAVFPPSAGDLGSTAARRAAAIRDAREEIRFP